MLRPRTPIQCRWRHYTFGQAHRRLSEGESPWLTRISPRSERGNRLSRRTSSSPRQSCFGRSRWMVQTFTGWSSDRPRAGAMSSSAALRTDALLMSLPQDSTPARRSTSTAADHTSQQAVCCTSRISKTSDSTGRRSIPTRNRLLRPQTSATPTEWWTQSEAALSACAKTTGTPLERPSTRSQACTPSREAKEMCLLVGTISTRILD